jgi:hypothetical protein
MLATKRSGASDRRAREQTRARTSAFDTRGDYRCRRKILAITKVFTGDRGRVSLTGVCRLPLITANISFGFFDKRPTLYGPPTK